MRRERQMEGIAKAKAEGRMNGRPVEIDTAKVKDLAAAGMTKTEIAKELSIRPQFCLSRSVTSLNDQDITRQRQHTLRVKSQITRH